MLIFDFFYWKLYDLFHYVKYGKPIHLFGVRCLCGMYGSGKTVSMTYIAQDFRNKYGNDILISTNFGCALQDFQFISREQLITNYDKPIIFLFDEVQNTFPSSMHNFPKEMREALTLNRKGHGKMFFWASQDHELVHKTIRRLTIEYGVCRTFFGRLTRVAWYTSLDYYQKYETVNVDNALKISPFKTVWFVQSNDLRSLYDSYSYDNGETIT